MATIVSVDAHQGILRRYEIGGAAYRLTHQALVGEKVSFTPQVIEMFRVTPPDRFRMTPDPHKPSGGTPKAQKAA